MLTYVLAADGSPLMPTYNIKKVRQMRKSGRAVIAGHKRKIAVPGTHGSGTKVLLPTKKDVSLKMVTIVYHAEAFV